MNILDHINDACAQFQGILEVEFFHLPFLFSLRVQGDPSAINAGFGYKDKNESLFFPWDDLYDIPCTLL